MVRVRANGQPAWGEYIRDPITGRLHVAGVLVVALAGDRISEITHFETTVAPYFSLLARSTSNRRTAVLES